MIATIILAILLGTGGLLYLANLGTNTPTIIQTLTVPLTIALENLFTILGYLAPLLIAIIPLYLTLKTQTPRIRSSLRLSTIHTCYLHWTR